MWQVSKYEKSNVQEFYRNIDDKEETIYAPICLANRYYIDNVLSAEGGFGIIYLAKDLRVNNRKVLIKSRRYDNEIGLFIYENDINRSNKIFDIRQEIEFEIECLRAFKENGECRMPTLNDVVIGLSPSIYGPHKDIQFNKTYYYTENNEYLKEPYIIMQYIDGENFLDYAKKRVSKINNAEGNNNQLIKQWEFDVLRFGLELGTLLNTFHKKQECDKEGYPYKYYIYQDLKPHNIIITEGSFLTLLDFGGMLEIRLDEKENTKSNFKYKGKAGVSTYGYRAPELCKGSSELTRLDNRVDIYSFGATIFSILIGEDLVKILKNETDKLPLNILRDMGYSEYTIKFIEKCTEYNKENRFDDICTARSKIYDILSKIKRGD